MPLGLLQLRIDRETCLYDQNPFDKLTCTGQKALGVVLVLKLGAFPSVAENLVSLLR
jgi:hypothetical protein